MSYHELIVSALTALKSNILRTLLTMLGIIIGIASVILIVSLGAGATQTITNQISSFGTNLVVVIPGSISQGGGAGIASIKTLTPEDGEAILSSGRVVNVAAVTPLVSKPTKAVAGGVDVATTVHGVASSYQIIQTIDIAQGEFLTEDHEQGLSRVAVIGADIAVDLFGEGAEPVGKSIKLDNRSFRIIGVAAPKGGSPLSNPDESVYIPYTTAMKILLGQNHVQTLMIQAEDPKLIDQTMEDINTLLIERHKIADGDDPDFSLRSSKDALATLDTVTGLLTTLLAGIAGISLLVGGIGIMNIMLVTVTERTKEIGLLKAIGAKRKDILTQFLIESVVLTLVGGSIGIILGIVLAFIITQVVNIPFIVQISSIFLAVGVSSIVGVGFGLYPAQRAAKLSPIEALRYE